MRPDHGGDAAIQQDRGILFGKGSAAIQPMKKTRVLVADDSALMRQLLKKIIAASADLDLVGLARDGEDAVSKARELRPDVVSMDINMPKLDGISALQILLAEEMPPFSWGGRDLAPVAAVADSASPAPLPEAAPPSPPADEKAAAS